MPAPSRSLRQLLETELDSFEKLEVALHLHAAGRAMSVEELALELQVGHQPLRRVALELARTGIVAVDEARDLVTLRADAETLDQLAEAARLFEEDRPGMLTLMTRIAMDRLRSLSGRTFADASQLRKRRDDG